jgi:DNA polymerase (family 10)
MENKQISAMFDDVADLLDIIGENPFRVRAYRNAARAIEDYPEKMEELVETGNSLTTIQGIGEGSAEKIKEIVRTGRLLYLEELLKKIPEGLLSLIRLEGLGPKRAKLIYDNLKIQDIEGLEEALKQGRIRDLPGMGEKIEQNLIKSLEHFRSTKDRVRIDIGMEMAEGLVRYLKNSKAVKRLEVVGSLRRRKETIGDIDILATADKGSDVMERFVKFPGVQDIVAKGETRSSIKLSNNINVDIRVLEPESFGAAMHYFTGSKEHNIAIRDRGKTKGLKISEYGIFSTKDEKRLGGLTEEEVFESVGLAFIPPEIRENRGEIEAAENNRLPNLIELKDIKGDMQVHTIATDGKNTIEEMAEKAVSLGYEYLCITDHSKQVRVARGLDDSQLLEHINKIKKVAQKFHDITILAGVEVDILEDGRLDISDDVLKRCDIVIAAIHYHTKMSAEQMTERIIKALKNPNVDIFAHPTGRLIPDRDAYPVHIKDVIKCCFDYNVVLEINAHPQRLDLNDINARLAKMCGVKLEISSDAHSTMQMDLMRFGIFVARRGWVEPGDVINTLPVEKMLKQLKKDKR